MGEVYKARDIRLDRWVAIKVLPEAVAADPDRLRRFEKEALAASALNHPNILSVYGVGSGDSIPHIAMEFVDGKTLRDLIAASPLPLRKILDISLQIAEALAAAHEAGIVHRDLKPSNVLISKEGFVKLFDFGLAKRAPAAVLDADSRASTESPSMTEPGALLGTVEYMSPEQASGLPVDARSDQFSFGLLVYEMACGRRAFHRQTTAETLVAILREDPRPLDELRPDLPAPIRWLVERCLAKSPEERFASTRDLAHDLRQLREHFSEIQSIDPAARRGAFAPSFARRIALPLIGVLLGAAIILTLRPGSSRSSNSVRFAILPPDGGSFNFDSGSPAPVAITSDGRRVVYGARDRKGSALLWVRSLEDVEARPLHGTEGATYPFWSPGGQSIAFFAEGKLKKIASGGGPLQVLADSRSGRGGSWNRDGVILFAPDSEGPLYRVPASGGMPEPATRVAKPEVGETHRWPSFLPDGRHFLYTVNDQGKALAEGGIYLGRLGSSDSRRLLPETSNAVYSPPGYLLFTRGGALFALAFDTDRVKPGSEPLPVADRVDYQPYRWNGVFAVSQTGVLAYVAGPSVNRSQLVWLDRSGQRVGTVGEAADFGGLRLSPVSDRCAVEIRDPHSGGIDVWVLDFARTTMARLTSGAPISDSPTWSPDGRSVVFSSHRARGWDVYQRDVTTTAVETLIAASQDTKTPTDWSADGRYLALTVSPLGKSHSELWLYSYSDRKAIPYLQTRFSVGEGRFSPDGRWMAYVADETGRPEVYVSPFPSADRRWQVSTAGGSQPVWSRTGDVFFVAPDRKLIAARIVTDPEFHVEALRPVFEIVEKSSSSDIPLYDVSRDGTRFLVNVPTQEQMSQPLTVVLGWAEGLGH